MTLRVDFSGRLVPPVKAWFFPNSLSPFLVSCFLCACLIFLLERSNPEEIFFFCCWGSLNWALRVYKVHFCQNSASFVGFFCFLGSAGWNLVGDFRVIIWYNSRIWGLGFEGVLGFSEQRKGYVFLLLNLSYILGFDICYFWWGWFVLCLRSCELFRVVLSLNVEVLGFFLKLWMVLFTLWVYRGTKYLVCGNGWCLSWDYTKDC